MQYGDVEYGSEEPADCLRIRQQTCSVKICPGLNTQFYISVASAIKLKTPTKFSIQARFWLYSSLSLEVVFEFDHGSFDFDCLRQLEVIHNYEIVTAVVYRMD